MILPKIFAKKLLSWSRNHPRVYPWTGEKDPYKIWISEIILQQTRSEQGKAYYENFISCYPDVKSLAESTEDEVLNHWKGLGYYSRARNLHFASKTIINKYGGIFPKRIEDIKSLKGIGDYSAAAISSFAFNTPVAVVDGNVVRVLSRVLGINVSFYNRNGKNIFYEIANKYLDKKSAANYNQAIMNFGAIQCKPQNPFCEKCIFSKVCFAFNNNKVDKLPIKSKKILLRKRYLHYFILQEKTGEIPLRKRMNKDIWQKLYELPLIETNKDFAFKSISQIKKSTNYFKFKTNSKIFFKGEIHQKLSHQEIICRFYSLKFTLIPFKIKQEFSYVKPENLVNFALPKIISEFLVNFNTK